MCGIAAMIALNGTKIDPLVIDRMSNAIKHRGPDDQGKFISDSVGLGFRRLSIIDLSRAANQPMASEDKQTIVTFNGEIFNYIELREELQSLGFVFKTKGDTEVLLNAYLKWGHDCLSKFDGMWAFIIYDLGQGKIFISRDRFGIKPLYIYRRDNFVFLGSEIKAITASGYYNGDINWKVVSNYLLRGELDESDETFYSGIERIPAGFALELDLKGALTKKRYWSLNTIPGPLPYDPAHLFSNIFEDSVKLRLRSDVPLGVCLSGGLDSTSIICSAARYNKTTLGENPDFLQAFCYMDENFDETSYIDDTLRLTGARLNRFHTDPREFWDILGKVMWYNDEPIHSMVGVISFELYKIAASKGMKVMLSGQGADEVLAGYPIYFKDYCYSLLGKRHFLTAWREMRAYCSMHGGNSYNYFKNALIHLPRTGLNKYDFYQKLKYWKHCKEARENSWFTPEMVDLSLRGFKAPHNSTTLNESLKHSIEIAFLPEYLRIEDRVSMAHSVEARLPFLDYRLVSYAFSLPDNWKMRSGWNKYVLREAMRNRIPESVRTRPDKMGFPISQDKWFAGVLFEHTYDMLKNSQAQDKQIYNTANIINDLEAHRKGKIDMSRDLFRVVQVELFRDLFNNIKK